MYATAFKVNPLDPATGTKYRNEILLPGGSREEMDSLKVKSFQCTLPDPFCVILKICLQEFLGRPPKPDAFTREILEAIGGTSAKI